jgi:hypothetical protein
MIKVFRLKIKVNKRTVVLVNASLFVIIAIINSSVVEALGEGRSVFHFTVYKDLLSGYLWPIVIFSILTAISIMRVDKISMVLFPIHSLGLSVFNLLIFFEKFDKTILIISFLYLLMSLYFYLLLKVELAEAYYNPCYSNNSLPSYFRKEVSLIIKTDERDYESHLTNWGVGGFFCRMTDEKPRGEVEFELRHGEGKFFGNGVVVASVDNGVGIKVRKSKKGKLNWFNFYDIINQLGLKPQRIVK